MGVQPETQQIVRRWLVLSDGIQSGPFPEPLILAQVADGKLSGQALVSCGSGWITAAEMAESCRAAPTGPAPAQDAEEFWEDDRAPKEDVKTEEVPAEQPPPAVEEKRTGPPPVPPRPVAVEPASPQPVTPPLPPLPAVPPSSVWPPLPPLPPPPPTAAAATAPELDAPVAAAASSLDGMPVRDRVVILGRRQSGKTIYLAQLYARLWRSLNGMTARALSGDVHKQLMDTVETLKRGEWPAATLETAHLEMEIEYHGRKHNVVLLDFAGELFARAFLHERTEDREARTLLNHIDRAAAVLLLVDPAVAGAGDHEAVMEDDFGLVQAVLRIRNAPGGDRVPIALCLTKMDVNGKLVAGAGGAKELVKRYFPPLVRMLKQVAIFSLSAVQVAPGADGRPRPVKDSKPVNLENPLKHCLRVTHQNEDDAARQRAQDEEYVAQQLEERRQRQREKRQNFWLVVGIGFLLLVGLIVVIAAIGNANRRAAEPIGGTTSSNSSNSFKR
jgi:hypothetical protein